MKKLLQLIKISHLNDLVDHMKNMALLYHYIYLYDWTNDIKYLHELHEIRQKNKFLHFLQKNTFLNILIKFFD